MLVLLNACFLGCTCFGSIAYTTVTWNAIHALPCLLFISDWFGYHQGPSQCVFGFENSPDIDAVPDASEFFGYTPYIRND
jgi:hypothetical protein